MGSRAGKFVVIGGIGFFVDGGILTVLNSLVGIDLLPSRLVSFSFAVTVTWYLNRHQTFNDSKDKRAAREWSRYAAANSIGAILNMGVFFWLVRRFDVLTSMPLAALAIASSIALVFNFLVSKHLVFKRRKT